MVICRRRVLLFFQQFVERRLLARGRLQAHDDLAELAGGIDWSLIVLGLGSGMDQGWEGGAARGVDGAGEPVLRVYAATQNEQDRATMFSHHIDHLQWGTWPENEIIA